MANDKLRAALQNAGLRPEELADIVAVDVRTVRRWLSGGAPYARHRGKVARALDTTEQQLWPEIARPAISDSLAAYTRADDPDAPTTETLVGDATERIELLERTFATLFANPGITELLLAKADEGCHVRIIVTSLHECLRPLVGHQQIGIKRIPVSADTVIHRVDDQMLVALSLDSEHDQQRPLLHVRERRAPGLFNRLARYYESMWQHTSEEITTGGELDNYLREHHDGAAGVSDGDRDTAVLEQDPSTLAARKTSEGPPRRWPRRPQ